MKELIGSKECTSEEIHEISQQPPPTCEIIDKALKEINDTQRRIRGYEKSDEDELRDMLSDVESNIASLSGYGQSGLLEDIRDRVTEIRQWGEEWKKYALSLYDLHESEVPTPPPDPLCKTSK